MCGVKLKISYDIGVSSTRFEPSYCLELAVQVEKAGFDFAWMGDHFLPWYHTGAHCPHAWVWMASALEKTQEIAIGTDVTVPMFKYHPAIVGQAFATMANMYPGRVILGVGTGEAMNEAPFISVWPKWNARSEALVEALDLIRKYWSSNSYFGFRGRHIQVNGEIFCYDKPKGTIPIYWSGFGSGSAFLAGMHGDHLMTGASPGNCKEVIFPKFEEGAKSAGKDVSEMDKCVYIETGYGDKKDLVEIHRNTLAGGLVPENLHETDPRKIEERGRKLDDKYIMERTYFFSNANECIDIIDNYREAGTDHIILGDYSPNPRNTVKFVGEEIIPQLRH
jgi:G6PDH family F420-dependent oxidoreductase